jgi:hypothetical protein
MLHSLYSQLSIVALVLICGLAIWKGAAAERAGASLILTTWLVTVMVVATAPRHHFPIAGFLISDAVLATGLLILALRYSSWWLGAAMLLQAIGLGLQAAYFAADRPEFDLSYRELLTAKQVLVLGKNLASCAMLLVLLAAMLATLIKRHRAAAPLKTGAAPFPRQAAVG